LQSFLFILLYNIIVMKICVYAICKNEAKFVDAWYESMKEADYIVVLDTGSIDDTVEKLKAHGVKVEIKEIKPWRFDVARNESLKLVPKDTDIYVCTDLDEVLEPGWAKVLRDKWIVGKHTRAEYKYIWSHLDNGEPGRVFGYNKIHDKNWEWRYPVHELLWHKTNHTENYQWENSLNVFNEITLHHYPDPTKSRGSYLGLLELREQEYPDDLYGLIYLSHEYRYRGFLEKSNEKLNKVLTVFEGKVGSIEKASCYLFMGDNYFDLKKYNEAIAAYLKGIEIEPTYRELYLNLAKVYLEIKEYKLATYYIKKGLEKSYRHYTWLERDLSWSYEPYDLLCLSYYYDESDKDGKLKALACAYKALTFEPENERLKNNLKLCLDNLKNIDF